MEPLSGNSRSSNVSPIGADAGYGGPSPVGDASGSTAEERELVRRMRAGEEAAFEAFADHYIPALYRFAATRLGERELIREIVQNTVCKVMQRLDSYRGEATLFTWLCACCRNEIAGYYRHQRAREGGELALDDPATEFSLASDSPDPETLLLETESSMLVHFALDHLPPVYATALRWKYLEGLSVVAIAGRLNLRAKAVESVLTRARKAFRATYEQLKGPRT